MRQNSSKLQEEGMAFEDVKTVQTTGGHNGGGGSDQLQREQKLNDLLRKADHCPNISYFKTQTPSVTSGKWETVLDNLSYVINSNEL